MPALLVAQNCEGYTHLIVGSGPLAASRCAKSLEAGARPILSCPEADEIHFSLATLIENGKVRWTRRRCQDEDLTTLGREEVDGFVDAVFVTQGPRHPLSIRIASLCRKMRIPINVVDAPQLCSFTLLSTYSDGPLQIGITTSGRGCKLSSRIRREIASSLPQNLGQSIERLGIMRRNIWEEDNSSIIANEPGSNEFEAEDEDLANQKHTFNTLVETSSPDPAIARTRRMRWLSQICEYWPLKRLAEITDEDVARVLEAYKTGSQYPPRDLSATDTVLPRTTRRSTITLAGSGPGHPSLLTIATKTSIETAHYILADKLVPSEILALIPRRTPVHIARKFPGNADAAQEELLSLALAALKEGKDVLRLKQGDPYLYGRGAEEVKFFREHGYEARVVPGVTSALSAPLFANIPVTHRSVADTVVVCTGTGRKGAAVTPPSYNPSKTVVFLMALHRLESLIQSLTNSYSDSSDPSQDSNQAQERTRWPLNTPCAIIERASCPDQRVIRSTIEHVCQAVEEEGSRPPGLLVVGWSCNVLHQVTAHQRWTVEEGFRALDDIGTFEGFDDLQLIEQSNSTEQTLPPVEDLSRGIRHISSPSVETMA